MIRDIMCFTRNAGFQIKAELIPVPTRHTKTAETNQKIVLNMDEC